MPFPQIEITIKYKSKPTDLPSPIITTSEQAVEVIMSVCDKKKILWVEELIMLCLYDTGKLMGWYKLSSGGTDNTSLDVRVITTMAAQTGAHKIILAHNHPSGNLIPSRADIEGTGHIKQALLTMGRNLADHIIFTESGYLSMYDAGYIA
jgi:DNA repair protein RadC